VTARDIRQAAHSRCNIHLRGLAGRVELRFGWEDLVLPQRVLQQLQEVEAGVRLRHQVHARWGFGGKLGSQTGASVLFSGVSGTGKTMAAGVVARSLGLELYKIDLSCVVSKYIGETERNLARIFDEAERSSAVLFFDEADALFGKRSEVKDAHDRYANIEVAYLLQRMEQFSGLAVLATNLSRNMDEAFVRRLQHVIEFPFPDVVHRERLWRSMFPETAPQSDDLDFDFLARQFEFSGGNIRNVVVAAAFLAADCGQAIGMDHLVQAIGREMQKMGKLPSKAIFQGHLEVITRQNSGRN
jgi:SpoVK/Ycf46/Vps4 family AAA+-type ATPase